MSNHELTPDFVRSLLSYDAKTGSMVWLKTLSNRAPKGSVIAYKTTGYPAVRILGKLYLVHRLAWLIMTNSWPQFEIDHIDGDRSNNCWKNLRSATIAQNRQNRAIPKNNSSGIKGVYWCKNASKWRAKIMVNKKAMHLGLFDSMESANNAYDVAAKKHHKEFRRVA